MDLRKLVSFSTLKNLRSSVLMRVIHGLFLVTLPVMMHESFRSV